MDTKGTFAGETITASYFCLASGSRQRRQREKAELESELVIHSWNGGHFSKDSYDGLLTFLSPWHIGGKKILSQKTRVKKRKSLIREVLFFTGGRKHWTGSSDWLRGLQGIQFNKRLRWNSICPSLPLTPFPSSSSQTDFAEWNVKGLQNHSTITYWTYKEHFRGLFSLSEQRGKLNISTKGPS